MKKSPHFSTWSRIPFSKMLSEIQPDPRGFVRLSGVENGMAGLDLMAYVSYLQAQAPSPDEDCELHPFDSHFDLECVGSAFSFCIGSTTYTAVSDPEDDYRSSLAFLIKRPGNLCSTPLPGIPLLADPDPQDYLFSLVHPSTREIALSVGTDFADEYPGFIGYHDPKVLQQALDLGLHLAYELDAELDKPKIISKLSRL